MKKVSLNILIVVLFIAAGCSFLSKEKDFDSLQKALVASANDNQHRRVISDLEELYLTMHIPDSVKKQIREDAATILDTTVIEPERYSKDLLDNSNIYEVENSLRDLLEKLIILRGQGSNEEFDKLLPLARKMAYKVDKETGNQYWISFTEETEKLTEDLAHSWLQAKQAFLRCKANHHLAESWMESEFSGAYGIQLLNEINDIRLRLDIKQLMQKILFNFRGHHELSIHYAVSLIIEADQNKYFLRENAIAYYQAEALIQIGQISDALKVLKDLQVLAQTYLQIPNMQWFIKNARFFIANAYWQMGEFQYVLKICEELEKFNLNMKEVQQIHVIKGLAYRGTGDYEKAESEYLKSLEFTKYTIDKILTLNNIGFMFYELTEFDKALDYYKQSLNLVETYYDKSHEYKSNVFISMAQVYAKQNKIKWAERYTIKARDLILQIGGKPFRTADLLNTLGELNLETGNSKEALQDFLRAEKICIDNNLRRDYLRIKINIGKTNAKLEQFSVARAAAIEALKIAKDINDIERQIDAMSLLASIEKDEGNIEKAIEMSNALTYKIENLSARFINKNRLTAFRQKIYDYLKNSVLNEISRHQLDSAFIKLDYAKARSLKNLYEVEISGTEAKPSSLNFLKVESLMDRLNDENMLIDFMLTSDSLYVFVLQNESLHLLRKKINLEELKNKVYNYNDLIKKTIALFNNYSNEDINKHYKNTSQISRSIYNDIFGFPELKPLLDGIKQIYIIPDEFFFDLPFSTLMAGNNDSLTFLAQRASIVSIPSSSFLPAAFINIDQQKLEKYRVLISADPVFPGANELVRYLRAVFPNAMEIAIDGNPTKEKVLKTINDKYDIYIFIGHGLANIKYPEQSYLEINMKNMVSNKRQKQRISIEDLKEIDWSETEMILLVGCETAGGKIYRSTGITGFQQTFVSLGARNVIGSLWKVDAARTLSQLKDFINAWINSGNAGLALQEAQIKTIDDLKNDSYFANPHPYFWGSYVYSNRIIN